MSILDRFEQKVEDAINGVFSKIGSHDLKPVDLMVSLRTKMDESVVSVKNGRRVSANVFKITLSTPDFDKIETWGTQEFANELASSLEDHSMAEIYSLLGDIVVTFEEDVDAEAGQYVITAEAKRLTDEEKVSNDASSGHENDSAWLGTDSSARVASNTDNDDVNSYPSVVIDDVRYVLANPVTVIGRGSNSDIIVNDSSISRRHLELRVTGSSTIATDLQSTNGMFVEGNKTKAVSLNDGNVITIGKTIIQYFDAKDSPVTTNPAHAESVNIAPQNAALAQATNSNISDSNVSDSNASQSAPQSTLARLASSSQSDINVAGATTTSAQSGRASFETSLPTAPEAGNTLKKPLNINPFDELGLSEPIDLNSARRGE